MVSAVGAGVDNVTICQSGGSCAMLTVTVPQTTTNINVYVFTRYLGYGDNGQDVLRLQQFLVQQGLLSANPTGHYGPATVAAMKRFQGAHGIRALGNMGPATENLLNQLLGSSTTSTTTRQQQILQIQQEMQQLQAQLAALEAGQ